MAIRIRRPTGVPVVFGDASQEPSSKGRDKDASSPRSAKDQVSKRHGAPRGMKRRRAQPAAAAGQRAAGKTTAHPVRKSQKPQKGQKPRQAPNPAPPRADATQTPEQPGPPRKPRQRRDAAPSEPGGRRASAEAMATRQRDISVSEFFTKNRHLLGFDSPARALLTTVKEAVDNSLDAAEEAGILPSVRVELVEVSEERYRVVVEDNGPGIVKAQVPKVFGKLLYGSKFHRLAQRRGQQGIGISAAGMYGQLTTGKPVVITSKTGKGRPAHHFEIVVDTARNLPVIVKDDVVPWERDHGTRVEIELQGTYKGGRRSVDEYLEQVALANPHAEITYQPPKERPAVHYPRLSEALPPEPQEIQPHPYGVELGALQHILKDTQARTVAAALQTEFSRVSAKVADEILRLAAVPSKRRPRELEPAQVERLHGAIAKVKIFAPPSSCVVPIGEALIQRGLEREIEAEFACSSTRPPAVYRGNPFVVEAGLAYGGDLREATDDEGEMLVTGKAEDAQQGPITLLRLANRVPLQYQQSACAIFRAAVETNWRQYGLSQPKGALPQGPMVLLVHLASVWVPFTSESKEAVAHYPEILKEIRLALQDCGRKLGGYLRRREHARREERRRGIFEMYIGEIVESLGKLTRTDRRKLQAKLLELARQHTGDGGEEAQPYVAPARRARRGDDEDDEATQMRLGLEEAR